MMGPKNVILRNFVWSDEYNEASFAGRLHEDCERNWEEYWLLERALYALAEPRSAHLELDWPIFKIFSHAFLEINCHFDPDDGIEIIGMDRPTAYNLRERFQSVFEGYFSNNLPNQKECFDVQNPLLHNKT
ncbi:MAG: immunity 41 family protein [Proteobacteria bacterium]|nr:immunity 41 family protein [Pseudomonadota bacterium]